MSNEKTGGFRPRIWDNSSKSSPAHPHRDEVAAVALDHDAVLGPQDLIDGIAEVGGLLREYPAAAPLATLVLLQLAVVLLHHGVVHADEGVTAARAVDTEQGQLRIVLFQDAVDKHVFVALRRLHSRVLVLDHRPARSGQVLHCQLVVGLRLHDVGVAAVTVFVLVVVQLAVGVLAVVPAEVGTQLLDEHVAVAVGLHKELVDDVVDFLLGGQSGHEVEVPGLAHTEEADGGTPVRYNLQGNGRVAVAVVYRGTKDIFRLVVEVGLPGHFHNHLALVGSIVDLLFLVDAVEAVLHFVEQVVHHLDEEGEVGLLLVLPPDVGETEVFQVVEGVATGEQQSFPTEERLYLVLEADDLVPGIGELARIRQLQQLDLHLYDAVPHAEQVDALFLLIVFGVVQDPAAGLGGRHGGGVLEAVVETHRVGAAGTEVLVVATVGGRHLVVVLLLVDGKGFVHNLEVNVLTTAAAFLALTDEGETRPVAEADDVVVAVDLLVRALEPGGRTFAHHEVAVLHVAHLAEQLERRRQGVGEQLAVGLAGDGCDGAGHCPHDLVHGEADVEALAGTTSLDGDVVLGAEHQPEYLGFGGRNGEVHSGNFRQRYDNGNFHYGTI